MDPFRLCLAFGPVTIYLLLLGIVNLGRRPLLVSGVRDTAALALAISGLVIVGPIELFFPVRGRHQTRHVRLGFAAWALFSMRPAVAAVASTAVGRLQYLGR
jgi:hypothetical protein